MEADLNLIRQLFLSGFLTDEKLLGQYEKLKTDEERFVFALDKVIQSSAILLDANCQQKDSEHSMRSRKIGNKSYVLGHFHSALRDYTVSIVHAADSSEELALAYGNRSAALFALNKHAECIDDIDRALDLNYPEKLRTKLYKRKGLSLTELGRPEAHSSFQQALIWLYKMTLSQCDIDKIENELKKLISASCTVAKPLAPNAVMQYPVAVPKMLSPNSELPSASDAVALMYSEKLGRHLVATRKIKPGEILAVEKPYCMRLFIKDIYTYCSYCLQVSWTMIPCKGCVFVAYCSEACKAKAWDEYHEIECPVVGLLLGFDVDDLLWMCMRMVIMATEKGKKMDALKLELINVDLNMDPRTKGYCSDEKFHSNKYRSVYSLACNVDKYSTPKLLAAAFWVGLTMCILARETEMFGKKLTLDTLTKNPNVIFAGKLMLKHTYICLINAHTFGAARCLTTFEHGHALMAVCSLLNHSCDPNTVKQWYSDSLVLYAAYPIEQGEQILDNYGPHYLVMEKSKRQKALSHWNFICECLPCKENWQQINDLPSYKSRLISPGTKEEIDKVSQEFVITHRRLIKQGIRGNEPNMLKELLGFIETLFRLVQTPCKELASAIATLEDLYAIAESIFDYIPANPSDSEKQYLVSYSCLESMLLHD